MENEITLIDKQEGRELALSRDAAQFIERFLSEADVAPTTKDTYRRALRQFFLWYAQRGGGDLTRADILAYKQAQLGKVQAATVGAYLTAVKSFFKWLEAEKLYPNVAAGVKSVRLSDMHRKDALTPAQAKRLLQTLRGDTLQAKRDFALVNLLLRTALRGVEVHRAVCSDMRNRGTQTVLMVQGKGRVEKDALVVLTEPTLGPIYDYLAARRAEGRDVVGDDSPLFASLSNKTYGRALSTRAIRQIVKEALRCAGFDSDRLTTHSLRHTGVTLALLGGASVQEAQALARHSSLVTTTRYSHNIDRVNKAPERFVDGLLDE